jgi:hypothetical protein
MLVFFILYSTSPPFHLEDSSPLNNSLSRSLLRGESGSLQASAVSSHLPFSETLHGGGAVSPPPTQSQELAEKRVEPPCHSSSNNFPTVSTHQPQAAEPNRARKKQGGTPGASQEKDPFPTITKPKPPWRPSGSSSPTTPVVPLRGKQQMRSLLPRKAHTYDSFFPPNTIMQEKLRKAAEADLNRLNIAGLDQTVFDHIFERCFRSFMENLSLFDVFCGAADCQDRALLALLTKKGYKEGQKPSSYIKNLVVLCCLLEACQEKKGTESFLGCFVPMQTTTTKEFRLLLQTIQSEMRTEGSPVGISMNHAQALYRSLCKMLSILTKTLVYQPDLTTLMPHCKLSELGFPTLSHTYSLINLFKKIEEKNISCILSLVHISREPEETRGSVYKLPRVSILGSYETIEVERPSITPSNDTERICFEICTFDAEEQLKIALETWLRSFDNLQRMFLEWAQFSDSDGKAPVASLLLDGKEIGYTNGMLTRTMLSRVMDGRPLISGRHVSAFATPTELKAALSESYRLTRDRLLKEDPRDDLVGTKE